MQGYGLFCVMMSNNSNNNNSNHNNDTKTIITKGNTMHGIVDRAHSLMLSFAPLHSASLIVIRIQ
jgi:hypothetical protein